MAWASVDYPIYFGPGTAARPLQVAYATPAAATGRPVALVQAACDAGAGSPPRSVLVYDRAESPSAPHLLQTLARDDDARLTGNLAVEGARLVATGSTYASPDVPRCCPDGTFTARWTWSGASNTPSPS